MQLDPIQRLRESIEDVFQDHQALKISLEKSQAQVGALQHVVAQVKEEAHSAKSEAAVAQAEVARLSGVNKALAKDLHDSERRLETLKRESMKALLFFEEEIAHVQGTVDAIQNAQPIDETARSDAHSPKLHVAGDADLASSAHINDDHIGDGHAQAAPDSDHDSFRAIEPAGGPSPVGGDPIQEALNEEIIPRIRGLVVQQGTKRKAAGEIGTHVAKRTKP